MKFTDATQCGFLVESNNFVMANGAPYVRSGLGNYARSLTLVHGVVRFSAGSATGSD